MALFSGGSLLSGPRGGRICSGPEHAHSLGVLQHGSLQRLASSPRDGPLPDPRWRLVLHASGAGRYTSTIGEEVSADPLLGIADADAFADHLLATPMPIPSFYRFQGPANAWVCRRCRRSPCRSWRRPSWRRCRRT